MLDTHVWAWALTGDKRLSAPAIQKMDQSADLFLSAVSFYEVTQKVRLGKWPEMAAHADNLAELALQQSIFIAPVSAEIAISAGRLAWDHRDPFDRHLAATARLFGLDLISADRVFDSLPDLRRIW